MLDDLVFLRPWALWLLPVAALIYLLARLWRASANQNLTNWIDPALLPYLSLSAQKRRSQRLLAPALALVWLLLCLALAAPSWSSREVPLRQNQQPLLVLLDLSWSMNATDLQPDRVSWARFKLEDLLKSRKDGLTGLVVYSGSAHLVVPFSSDQETILNLLPDLQPGIMPINGSRLDLALELAAQTYSDSGFADHGHLLIFTDGIALDTAERSADLLADIPASVSVIAIGNDNDSGVPIRSGDGFVRDNKGELVLSQSDWRGLDYLRANSNATLQRMQLDSSDIDSLLNKLQASSEDLQRQLAIREDQSHWLLLALLPIWLALWLYGRGSVLLALLALGSLSPQAQAEAFRNQDQQALELLRSEQYQQAAELFTSPEWRGYAHARQGNYQQALEELTSASDPSSVYNRGNAQLKSMQIEDAIATYEQLLESKALAEQLRADTEYNLAIAEQMLELMQQEQQQGESDQQQGQQDQQQGDQQQGQQQDGQQQQGQQQDSQQQEGQQQQGQQQDGQQQQGQQQDGQQQQGQQQGAQQQDSQQQQAEQQSGDSGNEQQQAAQQAEASGAEQQQSLSQQQQQLAQQLAEQAEASDEQQEGEDNGEQLSAEQMARIQARQQLQRQLQAIPDDPGGLLRRKFELQARQMSRPRYESIEDQL